MKDKINLSIIIVNYNSGDLLSKVIDSVRKNIVNIKYEIVVVDNKSTDKSLALINSEFPVNIIKLDSNLGFSKANNIGADNSKGDFLYFLNPDAFIIDTYTELLLDDLKKNDDVGIIAPEILNMNGSLQYNARLYPTIRRLFFYTFGVTKILQNRYICDYKMEYFDNSKPIYSDWVSGAAFIMKKKTFDEVFGFDESFFLFYEDVDLCRKVKTLGYKIKYSPIAKVKHIWGGTSEGLKEFTQKEEFLSRFKYFKKHHNNIIYNIIVLLTLFNIILRIVFFTIQWEPKKAVVFFKTLTIFRWRKK